DAWHARFGRLAGHLDARRLQLELTAGSRLVAARQLADRLGLHSIRGLAFAFDVQPLVRRIQDTYPAADGPDDARMLSLADRVLARVQGPMAEAWEARIKTLVDGMGSIGGRIYQEQRLL